MKAPWPLIPLEQIVDPARPITYGIVQPGPDLPNGVPYVRVVDIQGGTVLTHQLRRTSPEIAKSYRRSAIATGDILVSIRGHVGRTAIVPESATGANLTQDTARVAIASVADTRYVRKFIESPIARQWMAERTKGVAVTGINLGDLRQLPVLLPPLPEQRRIADILDKADAIRRKRKEAITLTENLLRSAFLEMFGDPVTNPKGWPVKALGELAERIVVGHVGPTSHGYADVGVPFLRTQNVRPMRIAIEDVRYITPAFHQQLDKSIIRGNDVLVSRVGANRGMAAVVPPALEGANCANILVITLGSQLESSYLAFVINSPRGERELIGASVGSAQGVINAGAIKIWELPVPPKSQQERFAQYAAVIQRATAKMEATVVDTDHLFSSLVHSAFRGELTSSSTPKRKQFGLFGDVA